MFDTHYEKELVINNRELKYKGIFRPGELFSAINQALEERGYVKREKKTEELVTEFGRGSYLELRPYKVKTNYIILMLKIKVTMDNLQEAVAKAREETAKFQQGDVLVVFDSWVLTDYESRWGMKPWFYFVKGVINKYLYTFPLEGGVKGELAEDTAYIYGKIKQLLHSYQPVQPKLVSERDVRKKMEEKIAEIKE